MEVAEFGVAGVDSWEGHHDLACGTPQRSSWCNILPWLPSAWNTLVPSELRWFRDDDMYPGHLESAENDLSDEMSDHTSSRVVSHGAQCKEVDEKVSGEGVDEEERESAEA